MPELVLDLLKFVLLAVLYIFIARAVRAIHLELRAPDRAAPSTSSGRANKKGGKVPRKVAVVEGDSLRGKTFDLGTELTIGRNEKCHITLDDTYVSQTHARIFSRGDTYLVEDLGSTNGTYINRKRITSPVELRRGDQVKIGKTVFEARK